MTDELVEVSGKSGPHVVRRPGTNGELVVATPSEAFRSRSPIKMSRGGTPQAISSESSAERHFAASRNDDGCLNVRITEDHRIRAKQTHPSAPPDGTDGKWSGRRRIAPRRQVRPQSPRIGTALYSSGVPDMKNAKGEMHHRFKWRSVHPT